MRLLCSCMSGAGDNPDLKKLFFGRKIQLKQLDYFLQEFDHEKKDRIYLNTYIDVHPCDPIFFRLCFFKHFTLYGADISA